MFNQRKKKILAVSHYYVTKNRGGGEVMFHQILKRLVEAGYEVHAVATSYEKGEDELDGVKLFYGKENIGMLNKNYSLLITQFQNAPIMLKAAEQMKIPSVYIVHNNLVSTDMVIKNYKPNLIIYNTNWIMDYYGKSENSIVIHPPVYAEEHATTPGEYVTLINLIPSKGSYTMYNIAKYFPRQIFMGVKGGYYKDQQVILRKPNVKIIENTDDMKNDVWAKTKILLMPSFYESYGMSGVEALASGIPVIANPTPGIKESLGYAGIFPKDNTIKSWVSAIASLSNQEEYKKASALALKRSAEINPRAELEVMVGKIKEITK